MRADELHGHGLFDRVHVGDRPVYLTALADAATLREDRSIEFRIRRVDASQSGQFHLGGNALPAARPAMPGKPMLASCEVVAVLRDVSERKAQELAVELARAESERANAAKSRFLATMSHELRTPLNAIIGFSEMLTNDSLTFDAARKQEYAKLINDSGRHLLSVVNGILDMSKMETGNFEITPEPFEPAPPILNCCDLLALKAREAGVEIRTRVAADLPEIVADRRALSQIVINLISNAIKFTPRGGSVTVGALRDGGQARLSASRIPALASAKMICSGSARRFSRRAPPMTAAMMARGSAFPSSRAWCGYTAAIWKFAASSAPARW